LTDARESAAAEVLRRTPAARRTLIRRLLAAPSEPPRLVSVPIDHLITRAPQPRPPRRRLYAKIIVQRWQAEVTTTARRWQAEARAGLRRAARRVLNRLRRPRRARR